VVEGGKYPTPFEKGGGSMSGGKICAEGEMSGSHSMLVSPISSVCFSYRRMKLSA